MEQLGDHAQLRLTVDDHDWTDVDKYTHGIDHVASVGADTSDVTYFSGHGGNTCSGLQFRTSVRVGQEWSGATRTCRPGIMAVGGTDPDTQERFSQWQFDGDVEILILDACNTLQRCLFLNQTFVGGQIALDESGPNIVLGYHGSSHDKSAQASAMGSYTAAARWNAVGEAWLDERYKSNISGSDDQCPVALGFGESGAVNDDFYFDAGFEDRFTTGSVHSVRSYYYLSGCDPHDGDPL